MPWRKGPGQPGRLGPSVAEALGASVSPRVNRRLGGSFGRTDPPRAQRHSWPAVPSAQGGRGRLTPGGPPCWDPQAQESPDGGDGSSSPVFPSPRQVTGSGNTNQQQQETDVREAPFLFPVSSPAPATARPAGPSAHDGPRRPPGASTAAQPLLDGTPFLSAPGPGWASPPGLQEGSYQKGSPGSHRALRRAQAQDLESTRGPWGLRALCGATAGHALPFTGGDGDRQGLGRWRSPPPHPHEGPPAPAPPFLPSLGHPRIQLLSICREAWPRGPLSEKEG